MNVLEGKKLVLSNDHLKTLAINPGEVDGVV